MQKLLLRPESQQEVSEGWQLEAQVWKGTAKGHHGRLGNYCAHRKSEEASFREDEDGRESE